jgi:hypothetical protein
LVVSNKRKRMPLSWKLSTNTDKSLIIGGAVIFEL